MTPPGGVKLDFNPNEVTAVLRRPDGLRPPPPPCGCPEPCHLMRRSGRLHGAVRRLGWRNRQDRWPRGYVPDQEPELPPATEVPGSSRSAASPPTANLLPKPPISARRAFSLPSVVT